jgi:outer membrane receptor for ferrienterochelin and colicin
MFFIHGYSQDTINYRLLTLEELMNIKVSVATNMEIPIRETPGIITVINGEDIKNSGARDMIELLQMFVPSFYFGIDSEGAVGDGFRGMWGYEGKILFMVDGQEFNDGVYGNVVFGNHFTLENIEKIEIIRGPGSAIYGGFAGLGVVNIITKNHEMNGGFLSFMDAQTSNSYSHRNVSFGIGKKNEDFAFSLTGVYGQGNRSGRDNIDFYGNSLTMKNNSDLDITNLNLNLNYKGLDFRAIADNYANTHIDLWGENYTKGALTDYHTGYFYQIKYDYKISDNFSISPRIRYKRQRPFNLNVPPNQNDSTDTGYNNNRRVDHTDAGISALWDINYQNNLAVGIEYSGDAIHRPDNPQPGEEEFNNGTNELKYTSYAGYLQYMLKTDIINFTAGARYDNSKEFGESFVPRLGLTKAWEKFHFKAIYSKSFRVPAGILPNRIQSGEKISPEKATNYEFEMGYRITENSWFTLNAYDVTFDKIIVAYYSLGAARASYKNSGKLGTQGLESEIKIVGRKFSLFLNYSYCQKSKDNKDVQGIYVDSLSGNLFAAPKHSLGMLMSFKLSDKLSLNPSLTYMGERFGYVRYDLPLAIFDPTYLININFIWKDVIQEHLDLSVGIHNLLNEDFKFLNPFYGHAPLPAFDQAFQIKVNYRF